MRNFGMILRMLSGQAFVLSFGGGGGSPGKPAAPKAALPAPAAIAPPKEKEEPVETFNPEAERKGVLRRPAFVLGSGQEQKKKFGQQTTLGAGL